MKLYSFQSLQFLNYVRLHLVCNLRIINTSIYHQYLPYIIHFYHPSLPSIFTTNLFVHSNTMSLSSESPRGQASMDQILFDQKSVELLASFVKVLFQPVIDELWQSIQRLVDSAPDSAPEGIYEPERHMLKIIMLGRLWLNPRRDGCNTSTTLGKYFNRFFQWNL
jgi:hypothetical protein